MEPHYLPEALKFIGPKEKTSIPLYLQFLFAHFGLDLVRMASIHTPSPFATALGLVGALPDRPDRGHGWILYPGGASLYRSCRTRRLLIAELGAEHGQPGSFSLF